MKTRIVSFPIPDAPDPGKDQRVNRAGDDEERVEDVRELVEVPSLAAPGRSRGGRARRGSGVRTQTNSCFEE